MFRSTKENIYEREVMLTPEQTKAYLQMQKLAHAKMNGKLMSQYRVNSAYAIATDNLWSFYS